MLLQQNSMECGEIETNGTLLMEELSVVHQLPPSNTPPPIDCRDPHASSCSPLAAGSSCSLSPRSPDQSPTTPTFDEVPLLRAVSAPTLSMTAESVPSVCTANSVSSDTCVRSSSGVSEKPCESKKKAQKCHEPTLMRSKQTIQSRRKRCLTLAGASSKRRPRSQRSSSPRKRKSRKASTSDRPPQCVQVASESGEIFRVGQRVISREG